MKFALALVAAIASAFAGSCAFEEKPDLDAAASFDRFPIYWLGESFEGYELESIGGLVEGYGAGVFIAYGTCKPSGLLEPSCTLPLQIQIFPLCYHLDAVALPSAQRRRIRGAPVGAQDGAPVLLTRRTQIKIYRGEGTDGRIALRAFEALRSLNGVQPRISSTSPIPPPPPGVLGGRRHCTDG